LISVVLRYRRADRVERLQLKWLVFSCGLLIAWILIVDVLAVEAFGLAPPRGGDIWFSLILLGVPLSAGIAILRYHLFEIDRIISRTISYGLVVALLAGSYAGGVFALSRIVPATGDLAVAGSTLAVAALFNPVRRRVQAWVDRRFNRSRYDAQLLVDSFADRLRAGSDLPVIVSDLGTMVSRAVEPTSATVWVRGAFQ
jgi:hypothetical protein